MPDIIAYHSMTARGVRFAPRSVAPTRSLPPTNLMNCASPLVLPSTTLVRFASYVNPGLFVTARISASW